MPDLRETFDRAIANLREHTYAPAPPPQFPASQFQPPLPPHVYIAEALQALYLLVSDIHEATVDQRSTAG